MAIYESGDSEENVHHLFALDIGIGWWFVHNMIVWSATGCTKSKSIVRIDCNLKVDRYISGLLRPVLFPCFWDLPNDIFQQDNRKLHVERCALTFLDTQDVWLLPWLAWFPDLSRIENIGSLIVERQPRHPSLLIWLMMFVICLKQHETSFPFMSANHNSSPSLTG